VIFGPKWAAGKKDSKNEGRSDDVYEKKGPQVPIFRHPTMCMKIQVVIAETGAEPTMFMKTKHVIENLATRRAVDRGRRGGVRESSYHG
jgi:hypothetical protein